VRNLNGSISLLACLTLYLLLNSPRLSDGAVQHANPGEPGAYTVAHAEYHYGDTACVFDPQSDQLLTCSDIPCGSTPSVPNLPSLEHSNSFPVELTASVHYPAIMRSLTAPEVPRKQFPLVLFLHGGHRACYEGTSADYEWPCTPPKKPIPSYQGFGYLGSVLASHGYIVVSISANGIKVAEENGHVGISAGMRARAQLIQKHLDLWKKFNGSDACQPFVDRFQNRVDLNNVGLMGHSLGGLGMIAYCNHYGPCKTPETQTTSSPSTPSAPSSTPIKALMTLTPYYHSSQLFITEVPFAMILSYCDGDLKDLDGVYYFDNVWYNSDKLRTGYSEKNDTSPRHMILAMGANHNYYNTIWTPGMFPAGAFDDWAARVENSSGGGPDPNGKDPYCGSVAHRLTAAQQRDAGLTYAMAFFRAYLGGETEFLPILTGDRLPPSAAMTQHAFVSYHAPYPAPASHCNPNEATTLHPDVRRLDINRLLHEDDNRQNTLCDTVSHAKRIVLQFYDKRMTEDDHYPERQSLSKFRLSWENTMPKGQGPAYQNLLPEAYRNVSGFRRLQLRTGVDFVGNDPPGDPAKPFEPAQNFSVELDDGTQTASVLVCDVYRHYHHAPCPLYYPPGPSTSDNTDPNPNPKVLLNMINIPIEVFKDHETFPGAKKDLKLENIQSVTLRFNGPKKKYGTIFISDIAFSK
jgi:hypothetical protein